MPTWGTYELYVTGEYNSPFPDKNIQEIEIIPSGPDTPATTIQTGGRGRKRAAMPIWIETNQEYQDLYDDYMISAVRVYTGLRSESMNAMISRLSPPIYLADGSILCEIEFLEV